MISTGRSLIHLIVVGEEKGFMTAATFGFTGPREKGALVLGRLGKNGSQMQRLIQGEADKVFVQHWRETKPCVIESDWTQFRRYSEHAEVGCAPKRVAVASDGSEDCRERPV